MMPIHRESGEQSPKSAIDTRNYQITVLGNLDQSWSGWLGGLSITNSSGKDGSRTTVLTGPVADQAALRGILSRLWDINMIVLSVTACEDDDSKEKLG